MKETCHQRLSTVRFHFYNVLQWQNYSERKHISGHHDLETREGLTEVGLKGIFRGDGNALNQVW